MTRQAMSRADRKCPSDGRSAGECTAESSRRDQAGPCAGTGKRYLHLLLLNRTGSWMNFREWPDAAGLTGMITGRIYTQQGIVRGLEDAAPRSIRLWKRLKDLRKKCLFRGYT
jgi:hypothetical protein